MIVMNFPRRVIKNGCPIQIDDNDILISIHCSDMARVYVKDKFHRVFYFQFDDVEDPNELNSITDEQAKGIADVIKYAMENNKNIIVHCLAGICRSGAVTRICENLGFIRQANHLSHEPQPNQLVYSKIRLYFKKLLYSWEEVKV